MRIALDAMGTDGAPTTEVAGALGALRELDDDLRIVLVGDEAVIRAELDRQDDVPLDRLSVHHAPDRVRAGESPATVVRRKPLSSIVVGLKLQQAGEADAFVSAGSTGAVMAASLFILRPLEGVDRPTVGTLFPTAAGLMLMLDSGANVDCKPQHLRQFAHLGTIYAQDMMGIENPRVGLLNIGEEPEKGDELALGAHGLLAADSNLNFVGNVEGREIIRGRCDVLVADGFVGNVLLKFYESVAQFLVGLLKGAIHDLETPTDLDEVFRMLDYSEYGGAPLLGVDGVSVICHGGSSAKAIQNGVRVAAQAVHTGMVPHMVRELPAFTRMPEPA